MQTSALRVTLVVFSLLGGVLAAPGIAGCSGQGPSKGAPSAPSDAAADAAAPDGGACAAGFAPASDTGCDPVLPQSPCPAGSSAVLGSTSCAPVGEATCPTGLVPHASGWGCDAVLPTAACTGATRESIGSTACVPVSDCTAPFPPANATHFVSAAYAAAELDSTHFLTVTAALAAAPAGAVIAVDQGTYSDALAPNADVTIVGRCADQVVFKSPAGGTTSAILIGGAQTATFKNITVDGYRGAVAVLGGNVTLESIVVQNSGYVGIAVGNPGTKAQLTNVVVRGTRAGPTDANAFGLYVGDGAAVTVTGSDFADNEYINVGVSGAPTPGASLQLSGSVVRDGRTFGSSGGFGWGVYGSMNVSVDIRDSAIVNNVGTGFNMYSTVAGATGSLTGSVVRGTTLDRVNKAADGVEVTRGTLTVKDSTLADCGLVDLNVSDGATATLSDTTLVGTSSADPTVLGPLGLVTHGATVTLDGIAIANTRAGAELEGKSSVTMTGSLVSGTRTSPSGYYTGGDYVGIGVLVETGAGLTVTGSAVEGTHSVGLLALGQVTAQGLLVRGTRGGGDGLNGRGVSVENGGQVTLAGSAILDNAEVGVIAMMKSAALTTTGSVIGQTSLDANGAYGIGVLLGGTATGTLTTTTIRSSEGTGLAVSGAGAMVQSSVIAENQVGVYVEDGTSLVEGTDMASPMSLAISPDTVFTGNATRVGSGAIPLPTVLSH